MLALIIEWYQQAALSAVSAWHLGGAGGIGSLAWLALAKAESWPTSASPAKTQHQLALAAAASAARRLREGVEAAQLAESESR